MMCVCLEEGMEFGTWFDFIDLCLWGERVSERGGGGGGGGGWGGEGIAECTLTVICDVCELWEEEGRKKRL